MKRRSFLKYSAGSLVGGFALAPALTRDLSRLAAGLPGRFASARRLLKRVGVQLYTVRTLMSESVEETLATVAGIGYKEVEFAGYFDRSHTEIVELLKSNGLTAPSTHVGLPMTEDDLDTLLEVSHAIGHDFITVPSLPAEFRESLDGFRKVSDRFNHIGEAAKKAGMKLAYHNHGFEFELMEGQRPYDLMLERTDPDLVDFQIDLYWAIEAGQDPVAYFKKHPGRFSSCHVKDMSEAGEMVEVGAGEIDFAAIFAHADTAGLKHYFVEHDWPEDPLESIRTSFENLSKL